MTTPFSYEDLMRMDRAYGAWLKSEAETAPPITPFAADLLPEDDVEDDDE